MSGSPVLRGTRIPAQAVIDNAADGYTAEDIVRDIYRSRWNNNDLVGQLRQVTGADFEVVKMVGLVTH